MSLKIDCGRIKDKEIEYLTVRTAVRVTDNIRDLCDRFFNEEQFLEDGEEVNVPVVYMDKLPNLINEIDNKAEEIFSQLKAVRGRERTAELVEALKDTWLMKKIVVELLINSQCNNEYILVLD